MGPDYLMLSPEVMVCSVLFGAAARTPHPLYFSEQPRRLPLHMTMPGKNCRRGPIGPQERLHNHQAASYLFIF